MGYPMVKILGWEFGGSHLLGGFSSLWGTWEVYDRRDKKNGTSVGYHGRSVVG
jgi:hypothetical protein